MLKTGLIEEIALSSCLFHSLSLWPEASSLTSLYLLAMTKMSIISFFFLYFLSALPLGILQQGMFFTLTSVLLKCTHFNRITHVLTVAHI